MGAGGGASTTAAPPADRQVARGSARTRLLDAAVAIIRAKGLNATTVDDLCAAAGVTKGAFFHHFPTKEALAVAAADHWSETTGALFAAAPYHDRATATERLLGYLDLRAALIEGAPADYSCLVGTMVQESFATLPEVRDACCRSIVQHASTLEADIAEALREHSVVAAVDPASLARYTQVVLQGAFVVSKATGDPRVVADAIEHLRSYVVAVLDGGATRERRGRSPGRPGRARPGGSTRRAR